MIAKTRLAWFCACVIVSAAAWIYPMQFAILLIVSAIFAMLLVLIGQYRKAGASALVTMMLIGVAAMFSALPIRSTADDVMVATMAKPWPWSFAITWLAPSVCLFFVGLAMLRYASTKRLPFTRAATAPKVPNRKATNRRTLSYAWEAMEVEP